MAPTSFTDADEFLGQSGAHLTPMLPLQLAAQRVCDGRGDRGSVQSRQLRGEALGFLVFDIHRHGVD